MRKHLFTIILILCFLNMRFYPCLGLHTDKTWSGNNINYIEKPVNNYAPVAAGILGVEEAVAGFTLAEVLITLTVIGVVAALTIPSLITRINNAQFTAKLQKEYSVLQQAYRLIIADAGGSILNNSDFNCSSSTCGWTESANAMNAFVAKMGVVKNCGSYKGCWYDSPLYYLGGGIDTPSIDNYWGSGWAGRSILTDGTLMFVYIFNNNCTSNYGSLGSPLYQSVCGEIVVDLNGPLSPNQEGRDVFSFWIAQKGIYPFGIFSDGYSCVKAQNWNASEGCTGKVLKEGAMNY